MKNFIERGEYLEWPNTAAGAVDVPPGAVVTAGLLTGVTVSLIPAGDKGTVQLEGVFELPKVAGVAFAIGDQLYWDATAGNLTKTAGTNAKIGAAWLPALPSDVVARVVLQNAV